MSKTLFVFCMMAACSCEAPPRSEEEFPARLAAEKEWVAYEGLLPSESGDTILAELYLKPASFGLESFYELKEHVHRPDFSIGTSSQGRYIVLAGSDGMKIIQLISRNMTGALAKGRMLKPVDLVREDLFLKSNGDHELILVDDQFNETIPGFSLRRRSDLFTVEGYFTVYNDTTEFFEKNTRKKWAVAQFGDYRDAIKKYHELAKEKHEGIYLKALAYSTPYGEHGGGEIDALVFKRILKADAAGTPHN